MAASTDKQCLRVLVTGANTGLGLAICKRLIDEFLQTRPASQFLHILVTTRSYKKSSATIATLQTYLSRTPLTKSKSSRVSFFAYELDLCNLIQVKVAARKIASEHPSLDVLVCNAGISGWVGLDWPKAIFDVCTNMVQSVTWPEFNIGTLKLVCAPQLSKNKNGNESSEPVLGQVFCANVFGHYILAHLLSEIMNARSVDSIYARARLLWTGTVDAPSNVFNIQDIQCLETRKAYESSKRLTDILVLTSSLPSTREMTSQFWGPAKGKGPKREKPGMYVSQPGVVSTDIFPLSWLLLQAKLLSFYIARLLGSPWHTISAYTGAVSTVWLCLATDTTLEELEDRDGKAKWGSATDVWGRERVRRTEIDGWGYGGIVGAEEKFGRKARRKGTGDLKEEELDAFMKTGQKAWEQMEALRSEWLGILEEAGED